jgi:phosphoribosylglycinamide formyltransferase-1
VRLAVLSSSKGTVFEALIKSGIKVELLVVDRACLAVQVANQHSVKVVNFYRDFSDDFNRARYSQELADLLKKWSIELVVMAGFGTILTQEFFDAFPQRVLNTHPSLLPAFKGWHAVKDALDYGVKITGTTVHIATADVDSGPILAQEPVRIDEQDTVDSLHEKIKEVERWLYPLTIKQYIKKLRKET